MNMAERILLARALESLSSRTVAVFKKKRKEKKSYQSDNEHTGNVGGWRQW
jgi:hypothetical protein